MTKKTKKKKVKFQETQGEEEEQLYNRNQSETISHSKKPRRFKQNHSLDSDEEFDDEDGKSDDKQKILNEDDIEGQEDGTIRNEEGITITPFNLREELEEGHFDAQGNYVANKDADATDQWLESADWDRIENQCHRVKKEVKKEEEDAILPRHKIMQDMVSIMKPGENVLKCLRRLGGNKKPVSSADRWKKKKLLVDEPLDEKAIENKANLLKLTGLADDLLQCGDYQIYERTYEQLSYEMKSKLSQFEDAEDDKPLERPLKKPKIEANQEEKKNIESDEDDELEAAFKNKTKNENDSDPTKSIYSEEEIEVKSVFGISKDKVSEKTIKAEENMLPEINWIYKLTDDENSEHLGPFSCTEMLEMQESSKFGDGVYCRKVGNEGSFHSSKRIDFDLYT